MTKKKLFLLIWIISLIGVSGILFFGKKIYASPGQNAIKDFLSSIEENQTPLPDLFPDIKSEMKDEIEIQPEAPISLVLPPPGDPPISLWRPPLYPTPWALSPHDHFFFARPIAADEINWPLANYRFGYFFPDTDIIHTGVDIPARRGTPVIAAAPGTVVWAGYGLYYGTYNEDDPYGLAVAIEHDFGYQDKKLLTVYGHMDRIDVEKGQRVETGTQLGIVGLTGFTTGPHLHFEVRVEMNSYFRTRNPELWLSPPQGWGVLVGQVKTFDNLYIHLKEVYIRNLDTNQSWMVLTYASNSINRDAYYQENLVLSDLPAGKYSISFTLDGTNYRNEIEIYPGAVSYFTFRENIGFSHALPSNNEPKNWQNIVLSEEFLP